MTNSRRVFVIIKSLILILLAVAMILNPDIGYIALLIIIEIALLVKGISLLFYYFTMTRYKVGGMATLYKGIFVIDATLLLFGLSKAPQKLIMIALVLMLAFEGVVYIMKAMKSKKLEAGNWKYQLLHGIFMFIVAIICIIFIDSYRIATLIFAVSLIVWAVSDIITAMRKTAIVYIG